MGQKAVLFLRYSRLAPTRLVPAAFAAAAGFFGAQSPAAAAPQETVLYNFTGGKDGNEPFAGLIFGRNGALYGTTAVGGTTNNGTVFQLTPPATGQTQWTETVLYSFAGGNDGAYPHGVIFGKNGALYGTTDLGGTSNNGTVFQLTPPATGQTQWAETVLYRFAGGNDGADPIAGVIFGANGALYGTTESGGASRFGHGTVFQLTPPATGQTQWTETVLHSFAGVNDGADPIAGVIFGEKGVLYGTTYLGETSRVGKGTVFQLTPPATGQTQWTEAVLYSFTGGNDGAAPVAGLIFGKNGALYGTTLGGGTLGGGTLFKLTPPAEGQTAWSETVLHSFGATGDGAEPRAGIIFGGALEGELFGTTLYGGTSNFGTVFRFRK